jgi:hypothetical protein
MPGPDGRLLSGLIVIDAASFIAGPVATTIRRRRDQDRAAAG